MQEPTHLGFPTHNPSSSSRRLRVPPPKHNKHKMSQKLIQTPNQSKRRENPILTSPISQPPNLGFQECPHSLASKELRERRGRNPSNSLVFSCFSHFLSLGFEGKNLSLFSHSSLEEWLPNERGKGCLREKNRVPHMGHYSHSSNGLKILSKKIKLTILHL